MMMSRTPRIKELSASAKSLLEVMRNGQQILFRAATGEATYSTPGHGEHYVTSALEELHKKGLVEVASMDSVVGWVYYKAKGEAE